MSIWTLSCKKRGCPNQYESNVSINQTIWEMRWDGWSVFANPSGQFFGVFCQEHCEEAPIPPDSRWIVECGECDWLEDETYASEEEARTAARTHELDHNCDCHDHWCVVVSPEKQAERKRRVSEAHRKFQQRETERRAQEHYVAYLMEEDQKRRDMQGQEKTREASQINTVGLVFIGLLLVAAVLLVWGAN